MEAEGHLELKGLIRQAALWLTGGTSPETRDRLLTTLIQRRPAVYISCAAFLLMGISGAVLVPAAWTYASLAAGLALNGHRLYLSFRYDDGVRPPTEGREAVVVSSFAMFLVFGAGCAAAVATGHPVLRPMALISTLGLIIGLVSRWAAFPRLAFLTITLVAAPVCYALVTAAGSSLWLAAAQFALVAVIAGAQTLQNHYILVRMLRAERRTRQLARTDLLTGLGNRTRLYARLGAACRRLRSRPSDAAAHFALLYVDLDGFKEVNDSHGHATGDRLLQLIGRRLAVTAGDSAYRIGGDEFVILMPGADATAAADLAAGIIAVVSAPQELGPGAPVRISASIGIALAPEDGTDPQRLIAHADRALYSAKHGGKARYVRFAA